MSTLGQFLGSGIKSIQRGSTLVSTGGTPVPVTVTSVVTAKSELRWLGASGGGGSSGVVLANATTVTVHASTNAMTVYWELVERY